MATKSPPSKQSTKHLNELLDGLSIGSVVSGKKGVLSEPNPKFQRELNKTRFSIFQCISDLGHFTWNPAGPYKLLSRVTTSKEIREQIDLGGKPDKLVPISSLGLPKRFLVLSPQAYENRYPHGQIDIACLHVAFQERAVNHEKVDFAFGGSTLEMLATQDASSNYLVTMVPGTKVILVVKQKMYTQNYSDLGFQFERLATGNQFSDRHVVSSVEHMHLMQVGPYCVFFRAEADALHEGEPAEIKAANPTYYGTRVMFQMISNGSPTLCQGTKSRGVLVGANLTSLSEVARDALFSCGGVAELENRILNGMSSIKEQMETVEARTVFKVRFREGDLKLSPVPETRGSTLLPPDHIVKELLL